MKPDIIYPLGRSFSQHRELKYSLRSLEKYAKDMFYRVIVVGELPEWWSKPEFHIPMKQDNTSVNGDQIAKILRGCEEVPLGRWFVLMNDDFFLLDRPEWGIACVTRALTSNDNYHWRCMENTKMILGGMGVLDSSQHYELHMPMPMTPSRFKLLSPYRDVAFRTLYGYMGHDAAQMVESDVKMRVKFQDPRQAFPGSWCFSIDDTVGYHKEFKEWAEKEYPNKSRWEK